MLRPAKALLLAQQASRQLRLCRAPARSLSTPSAQQKQPPASSTQGDSTPAPKHTASSTQGPPQGPVTWKVLGLSAALGTAGLVYYSTEHERRIKEISSSKTVGRAAIGGEFSVVDARGRPFTHADLKGHWSLMYFGFTMCPDICPAELSKLGEALQMLEKRGRAVGRDTSAAEDAGKNILPIFVSIDPERDSAARSHEYAAEFHPGFIGLSGDVDSVRAMAKKYRIYYSKDVPEDDPDDYLVDHSIITFLMDPNGEFQEFYTKNASAVEIASRIETKMMAWKPE